MLPQSHEAQADQAEEACCQQEDVVIATRYAFVRIGAAAGIGLGIYAVIEGELFPYFEEKFSGGEAGALLGEALSGVFVAAVVVGSCLASSALHRFVLADKAASLIYHLPIVAKNTAQRIKNGFSSCIGFFKNKKHQPPEALAQVVVAMAPGSSTATLEPLPLVNMAAHSPITPSTIAAVREALRVSPVTPRTTERFVRILSLNVEGNESMAAARPSLPPLTLPEVESKPDSLQRRVHYADTPKPVVVRDPQTHTRKIRPRRVKTPKPELFSHRKVKANITALPRTPKPRPKRVAAQRRGLRSS